MIDINAEVSNYNQFILDLINYLDYNPVIKFSELKRKANKLYHKNNFEIKEKSWKYLL